MYFCMKQGKTYTYLQKTVQKFGIIYLKINNTNTNRMKRWKSYKFTNLE